VAFHGGEGVGRVTKPGLPLPVGEPAINPVPRKMIRASLEQVWKQAAPGQAMRLEVEIFVPRGEEMARHTLNPRLGIVGGISILGTTGLVKPFSHDAYRATIVAGLKVAKAMEIPEVVFTTGGKSEAAMQALLPRLPIESFVQMGDYVRFALRTASNLKFQKITVGAFFGKALKIAEGKGHTHASKGLPNLAELGRWVRESGGSAALAREVARANTARQALEILTSAQALKIVSQIGQFMLASLRSYASEGVDLSAVILDFGGSPLWQGGAGGNS
jgi:cobalt-precorrin-5B (C1)-methyltransferase